MYNGTHPGRPQWKSWIRGVLVVTVRQGAPNLFCMSSPDWDKFKAKMLRFEREQFPASLQETAADLQILIQSPTSIVIGVRTEDNPLAGYVASDVLERFGDVPGTQRDRHWGHGDTHYIASVVVAPDLRHQGVGARLIQDCARAAFERGFRRVTAHVEAGAARKIDPRTCVLGSYPDWYGTGRLFEYIELIPEIAQ
jgi:ribosomal protein S18 acetylase RimI-like enzyme